MPYYLGSSCQTNIIVEAENEDLGINKLSDIFTQKLKHFGFEPENVKVLSIKREFFSPTTEFHLEDNEYLEIKKF